MAVSGLNSNVKDGVSPEKRLEDYVVECLNSSGGVAAFDRARFYCLSEGLSDEALGRVKDGARRRIRERYSSALAGGDARPEEKFFSDSFMSMVDNLSFSAERLLDDFFAPWSRLAGRIENVFVQDAEAGRRVDEARFVEVCNDFFRKPEYGPYREMQIWYVYIQCSKLMLDYTKLPAGMKTPELESSFRRDYPFLVVDMRDQLVLLAFNLGKKEKNSGFTYCPVTFGPELEAKDVRGPVRGLVFMNDDRPLRCLALYGEGNGVPLKMVSLEDMPKDIVRKTLERVYHMWRYSLCTSVGMPSVEEAVVARNKEDRKMRRWAGDPERSARTEGKIGKVKFSL